jgi:hypothetical protein
VHGQIADDHIAQYALVCEPSSRMCSTALPSTPLTRLATVVVSQVRASMRRIRCLPSPTNRSPSGSLGTAGGEFRADGGLTPVHVGTGRNATGGARAAVLLASRDPGRLAATGEDAKTRRSGVALLRRGTGQLLGRRDERCASMV